jgi:signal transduction histidine kinase
MTHTSLSRRCSTATRAVDERAARRELDRLSRERAALRRVAALVAQAVPPDVLFAAVAAEVGRVFPVADCVMIGRYESGRAVEVVGGWNRAGGGRLAGRREGLGGRTVSTVVFESNQPARVNDPGEHPGLADECGVEAGMRSAAGAPIRVAGRLWGVMLIASAGSQALPAGAEHRLAEFTELLAATAIANAEAHAALMASRARIIAAADETRRRIERDLHDGAQQRLVSLALRLRVAQAAVPAGLGDLDAELGRVAAGLTSVLDELRDYARGIHPAILAHGGLAPALRGLARRSAVPVQLDVRLKGRLPERVEVTAYYVVSEALTNAAKYANASAVRVAVHTVGGIVRVCVSDDGDGGADPARGSGLTGLMDRVAAIGGRLLLGSQPDAGTCLLADLPAEAGPEVTVQVNLPGHGGGPGRVPRADRLAGVRLLWHRRGAGAAKRRGAGNLSAELTSFVGRRGELAEVRRLLSESRLVTLTGVGGVGKTRPALRAAAGLVRAFGDGVWLVRLDQLLHAAPRLRVLATSRESLNIDGETVLPVAPRRRRTPGSRRRRRSSGRSRR